MRYVLALMLVLMMAGCGRDEGNADPVDATPADTDTIAGETQEPDSQPDSGELRREIDSLNRKRRQAQAEREALESELDALNSALDDAQAETSRLEAKVRRLEDGE